MNRNNIYLTVIMVLIFSLYACKAKKIESTETDNKNITTMLIWDKINDSNFEYEWFYAKAGSQVSFEGFTIGGQADIRVRRDSAILISVKKFGFELVRALIRPDSMFAINRLEGSFVAMSIDSLKSSYDVPFDYGELQEIIVGNKIVKGQVPLSSITNTSGYSFKSGGEHLQIDYLLDEHYNVFESMYKDDKGRSFDLTLDDYKAFDTDVVLPSKRSYYYPSKENASYSLMLDLDEIELDQAKKIKFEVPSSYTEM